MEMLGKRDHGGCRVWVVHLVCKGCKCNISDSMSVAWRVSWIFSLPSSLAVCYDDQFPGRSETSWRPARYRLLLIAGVEEAPEEMHLLNTIGCFKSSLESAWDWLSEAGAGQEVCSFQPATNKIRGRKRQHWKDRRWRLIVKGGLL